MEPAKKVGDAVRVIEEDKHNLPDRHQHQDPDIPYLFEAVYMGKSKSYNIHGISFGQGKTRLISDGEIAKKLMATPHFQVRVATRGRVEIGRVFQIYMQQGSMELQQGSMEFWMGDLLEDPAEFDYVVVAPNGAVASCKEVIPVTASELTTLQGMEIEELANGNQPYRNKLQLIGKGKWGSLEGE